MFKKLLTLTLAAMVVLLTNLSFANTTLSPLAEETIDRYAEKAYPDNKRMQLYTYNRQMAAYVYISTVKNRTLRKLVGKRHPGNYELQKYVFNQQIEALKYMENKADGQIKKMAVTRYQHDYIMQKRVFDEQSEAFGYMKSMAKKHYKLYLTVYRMSMNDYVLQKHFFNKLFK